jgi:hypothetical protein
VNGGGPAEVYGNNRWPNGANRGVCGDALKDLTYPALYHESGGPFEKTVGIRVTHYHAGDTISVKGKLTANHLGYMQVELCVLPPTSKGGVGERRVLTNECFKRGGKLRVMQNGAWGDRFYVNNRLSEFEFPAKLPDIVCPRCVVRWYYITGNSCTPPGTPTSWADGDLSTCGSANAPNPEEFWNCADVALLRRGDPLPAMSRLAIKGSLSTGISTNSSVDRDGQRIDRDTDGGGDGEGGQSIVGFSDVAISVAVGTGVGLPVVFMSPIVGTALGLLVFAVVLVVFMIQNGQEGSSRSLP